MMRMMLSQSTTMMIMMIMIIIICFHSWNNNNNNNGDHQYQFVVLAKSTTSIERSFRRRNNHHIQYLDDAFLHTEDNNENDDNNKSTNNEYDYGSCTSFHRLFGSQKQQSKQIVLSNSGMISSSSSFTPSVWGIHNNRHDQNHESNIDFPIWGISSNILLSLRGGDDDDQEQQTRTMSPSAAPISHPSINQNNQKQQQLPTTTTKKKKKKTIIKKKKIVKNIQDQQKQHDAKTMKQQQQHHHNSANLDDITDNVGTKVIANSSNVDDNDLHRNDDNDKRISSIKKKTKKKKLKKRKMTNSHAEQTSLSSSSIRPPLSSLKRTTASKSIDHHNVDYHHKRQQQQNFDDRDIHVTNVTPKANNNIVVSKKKKKNITIKKKMNNGLLISDNNKNINLHKKKKKTSSSSSKSTSNTFLPQHKSSKQQTEVSSTTNNKSINYNNDITKRRQTTSSKLSSLSSLSDSNSVVDNNNKINSNKKKKKTKMKKKKTSSSSKTIASTNTFLLPQQSSSLLSKRTVVNTNKKSIGTNNTNVMTKRRQNAVESLLSDSIDDVVVTPSIIQNRKKVDVSNSKTKKKIIKKTKKVIINKKRDDGKTMMTQISNQQKQKNGKLKTSKTKSHLKKNTSLYNNEELPISKHSSSVYSDNDGDDDDDVNVRNNKAIKFMNNNNNNVKMDNIHTSSSSQSKLKQQDIDTMEYAKTTKMDNNNNINKSIKKNKTKKIIKKKKKSIMIKETSKIDMMNTDDNNVSDVDNTRKSVVTKKINNNNVIDKSKSDNFDDYNNKDLVIQKKKKKMVKKKIDLKKTIKKKKKMKKTTMKKRNLLKKEEEKLDNEIKIDVSNNEKENDEKYVMNLTKSSSMSTTPITLNEGESNSTIKNINNKYGDDTIRSITIVEEGNNKQITKSNSSSFASTILMGISSTILNQSEHNDTSQQQSVEANETEDILLNGINNIVGEHSTNIDVPLVNDDDDDDDDDDIQNNENIDLLSASTIIPSVVTMADLSSSPSILVPEVSNLLLDENMIDSQSIGAELINSNTSTHIASTIDNGNNHANKNSTEDDEIFTNTTRVNITQSISSVEKDDIDDDDDDDDDDTDDEGISTKTDDDDDDGNILLDIINHDESKIKSDNFDDTDDHTNSTYVASSEPTNKFASDAGEVSINAQTISEHSIEDAEENAQARMTATAATEVPGNDAKNTASTTSHSSSQKNQEVIDDDDDDSDDSDDDIDDDSNSKQLKHDDDNSDEDDDDDEDDEEEEEEDDDDEEEEEENSEEKESSSKIVTESHGKDEDIDVNKSNKSLLNSLKDPNGFAAERSTLGMTGSYLSGFKQSAQNQVPASSVADMDIEEESQEGNDSSANEEAHRIEDDNDVQIEKEENGEGNHSEYEQILQDTHGDQNTPSDSTHKPAVDSIDVSEDLSSAEILNIVSDQDGRLHDTKLEILSYDRQTRTNRTLSEVDSQTPSAKTHEDTTDVPELSAAENQRQILEKLAIARKNEDDDSCDILVSVVTWNLAEESPSEEEASFFRRFRSASRKNNMKKRVSEITFEQRGSDIILISAQECENIKPRRAEGSRSREFRRLMIKMLGKEYVPLAIHLLGGIQFGLFCKSSLLIDVEHVSIADVTCGIGNVFHNKGAIGAFVQMKARKPNKDSQQTSKSIRMLFVTAHMAAHVSNFAARDSDYWRIVNELEAQAPTHFLPPRRHNVTDGRSSGSYLIDSMDRVFFCGDLNYRIDLPRETVEYSVKQMMKIHDQTSYLKRNKVSDEIKRKINKIRQKLLKSDQLYSSISEKRAFIGFSEGPILFPPTFKYDKQSDDYDTSNKQRIPAWTDRILFKPEGTKVLQYDAIQSAKHSDHRPVYGTFRVNLKGRSITIPTKKKQMVKKQQIQPTVSKKREGKMTKSRKKVTSKQKSSTKQRSKTNVLDQKLPKKRKKVVVQRIENE